MQGEKIRDLDTCLEHHREKLNATEELLQQVRPIENSPFCLHHFNAALTSVCLAPQELVNRTALETQKLELMTEVSSLKLKLSAVERDHRDSEVDSHPENVPSQFMKWRSDNEVLSCTSTLLYLMCETGSWQASSHCFKVTKVFLTRLEDSEICHVTQSELL